MVAAVLHQALGVLTFATVTLLMWRAVQPGLQHRAVGEKDGLALRGA